jgi:6-phosphogluconolactonase
MSDTQKPSTPEALSSGTRETPRGLTLVCRPDASSVVEEAFAHVRRAALAAAKARGTFRLALAGGSTPKSLYQRLASDPTACPWAATELFFGDERCVPPGHPDSNFGMVERTLLSGGIAPRALHRMEGEREPAAAAAAYDGLLSTPLDLALLGMGADGHTASLFPSTTALNESQRRCVAVYVEKLAASRLTLTYPVFEAAEELLFLVTGADKAETLRDVLTGPREPTRFPSQRLYWGHRRVTLCCDAAAAAALPAAFVAAHAATAESRGA